MIDSDDGNILSAITRHDPDALVLLYDRYGRIAFGLAYRILGDATTAEEVVQDAFMSVWRRAESFDASRGNCKSWLLSIVRNRAIDQLRGRFGSRRGEVDFDVLAPLLAGPDVWSEVLEGLRAETVRTALESLPDEQRRVIDLAYFEGLTQQEIAERTGSPLGTVKSRMRLGLRKLHDELTALVSEGIDGNDNGQ